MIKSDRPTPDEILGAINDSGYLMEQEVASELEALSFHVHPHQAFEDKDLGKSREIDIVAIDRIYLHEANDIHVFLELICECKNSANPFVFLLRPRTPADEYREVEEIVMPRAKIEVSVPGSPNTRRIYQAIDHLGVRQFRPQTSERLKAVQFAKIVRDNKKWVANHAGLYDAIFYPLVKALRARQHEFRGHKARGSYIWLYFPVVITSGELFVIDTTAAELRAESVDHVSFTRHINSSNLEGYFTIDFVTRPGLAPFVERARTFAANVGELVQARPTDFTKE